MKTLILILVNLIFFINLCFSQSYCKELEEGITYFKVHDLENAVKSFELLKNKSKKGDYCYMKSCEWLAKSIFLNNPNSSDILRNLKESISYNNLDALKFYALQYPTSNPDIDVSIDAKAFYGMYNMGEVSFLFANIFAKNYSKVQREYTYTYLITSLSEGYSSTELFENNFIRKLDEERYLKIINELRPKEYLEFRIKKYIESIINEWQKKGKYEKTPTYQKRVTEENRQAKIEELTQEFINNEGIKKFEFVNAKNEYDADNEIFKITFTNSKSIYLPVQLIEAENFDRNFDKLKFLEPEFTYAKGGFDILSIVVLNPDNGKKYIYKSSELVAFNTNTLSLNLDEIAISLNSKETKNNVIEGKNIISVGKSDVDENIPLNSNVNSNRYALVIGNEDYTLYQSGINSESNVDFARVDAITFSKYCINTLGVPKENVVLLTDAISSQMKREIEKLSKIAKYSNGHAELIFYYAGHGFPEENTKESYLMPVDISGTDVTSGIKLTDLYSSLTTYPSQKVTVFLDACFSGSGRNQGLLAARGVKIVPKNNLISGNLIVFSASSGDQSSLPYKQKQHGMFTYFLLKKLQETSGNITYGALSNYLVNQVQLNSVKVNSKDQNPQTLFSTSISDSWENWTFKIDY